MKQMKIINHKHRLFCMLSFSAIAVLALANMSLDFPERTYSLQNSPALQHAENELAGQETKNGRKDIRERGIETQNGYSSVKGYPEFA
ncbi:MAG: hypothetical protein D3909_12085 [Candidatus Electrothrix sp. ATG1]|nr:hypothetical protein [Candidatus Electrothrix sp. ATG1]